MNSSEAIRHTLRIGIWKRRWGRTPAAGVHKLETGFQSRCRLARNGQYAKGQTDEALASAIEALEFANRTGVAYWKPKLCRLRLNLASRLQRVQDNLCGNRVVRSENFQELVRYFPAVDQDVWYGSASSIR